MPSLAGSPTLPATGANPEHFQNVRHLDEPSFLPKFNEIRVDAYVDTLRPTAGSTGKVVVMVRPVGEAVHLGAVLAHPALHRAGSLERFQASIYRDDVASLGIESLEGFLGGKRALRLGEDAKDGSPLFGDAQSGRSQSGYGLIEKVRVGAFAHESNLTNGYGCEKSIM